jgi:hypothetical protein
MDHRIDIDVEYVHDKKNEGRVPVSRRRAAIAGAAVVAAAALATTASHGGPSETTPAPAHHNVHELPDSITYTVKKNDVKGADHIAGKFSSNYTELKEVSGDIVTEDPILNQGEEVQIPTEHMDEQKVEDFLQQQNSARH